MKHTGETTHAEINIKLVGRKSLIKLTLPPKYQSLQWLSEVAETLEDAKEVEYVSFVSAGFDPDRDLPPR